MLYIVFMAPSGRNSINILYKKLWKMKNLTVIFDRPVILPGDKLERITSYGMLLPKSKKATFLNIGTYITYYVKVVEQIFKDGKVEICNGETYKKDGLYFIIDDDEWDKYAIKAEKAKMQFAVIEDDNIEIKDEDRYDILLTNKEEWEVLKARKDVIWHSKSGCPK